MESPIDHKSLISEAINKTSTTYKLERTTKLKDLPKETRLALKELYETNRIEIKLYAVILNSCITQGLETFLFSKRIFENLVNNDSNLKRENISGTEYNRCLANWIRGDLLKVVQQSSKWDSSRPKKENRAGVIQLTYKPFIDLIYGKFGEELVKFQISECINFYNQKESNSTHIDNPQDQPSETTLVQVSEYVSIHDNVKEYVDSEKLNLSPHSVDVAKPTKEFEEFLKLFELNASGIKVYSCSSIVFDYLKFWFASGAGMVSFAMIEKVLRENVEQYDGAPEYNKQELEHLNKILINIRNKYNELNLQSKVDLVGNLVQIKNVK